MYDLCAASATINCLRFSSNEETFEIGLESPAVHDHVGAVRAVPAVIALKICMNRFEWKEREEQKKKKMRRREHFELKT
jgi:hypothetical protein